MPSRSLYTWRTACAAALDELEAAHVAIGGTGPGRRTATQQINYAYAVLLSSQFQRFCRDLHSEACDVLAAATSPSPVQKILHGELIGGRKLDVGNPNPGNLGSDFGRFGMEFWDVVNARNPSNARRRVTLEELNGWRNAIAHQHFDAAKFGTGTLPVATVRRWRRACGALARQFDLAVASHLRTITGVAPW